MEGLHIDPSLDLQEQIEILQKYKMTTSGTQTTQSMTNLTEEYLTSTLEAEKPKENEDQTLEIPPAPPIPLPPPLPGEEKIKLSIIKFLCCDKVQFHFLPHWKQILQLENRILQISHCQL